jgi:hypothetical protein
VSDRDPNQQHQCYLPTFCVLTCCCVSAACDEIFILFSVCFCVFGCSPLKSLLLVPEGDSFSFYCLEAVAKFSGKLSCAES